MTATMALRPYQEQAYEAIIDGLARGVRRPLLELPTGAGKTVIFATLIVRRGGTALVIAHRDELLDQAADKLTQVDPTLGLSIGFVAGKANEWGAPIVIASAQTLASTRRLAQLPRTFTTAITDEAHHAVAASYKRVLDHLTDVDLIAGVTATATRADGKDLSEVWDEVVFRRTIVEMIQDGYLCDVRGVRVSVNARLDDIRLSAGDLDADALGAALTDASAPAHIVAAYQQHAAGRRSILFVPTVALAHTTASVFRAAGITAEALDGSTDPVTREQIIDRLHSGKTMVLSNVAVLCLDGETEILTDRGWTGPSEMSFEHEVANWWPDGSITWEPPKDIVRRPRQPGERMVFLETRNRSIRVTEGHRMLHRADARFAWTKDAARNLVGRTRQLPVSGRSAPRVVTSAAAENVSERRLRRLVSSSAYNLRERADYGWGASFAEAERRIRRRRALRPKAPSEVTLAECWLIGFWIGDGSVNRKNTGGLEYTLAQSTAYPAIIAHVDSKLGETGIHVNRYLMPARGNGRASIRWTLPRGTGSGSQERVGVYAIEHYLRKEGAELLWGLTEAQFDALIEGLWFADGDHRDGAIIPRTLRIHTSNVALPDLLQAVAVCRGYRAHLHRPARVYKPHHTPMRELVLRKEDAHRMSNRLPASTMQFEELWRPEEVWCVRTTSSNLITRRRGTVTVMGNTEGFDAPCVDCVIMATPTKSTIRYTQCVGRGLRLHSGKQDLLVLDVVGVTERLALQTFPGLFGLTTMPGATTTVTTAIAAHRASAASAPDELADVSAAADTTSATAVDMLSGAPAAGLHWLRHGEAWLVAAGRAGVVALVPGDRGRWQGLRLSGDSQDRIAGGVELGDAQGIAHEYLNHVGVARLADPEASWRAASATSAQRSVLARLGVSAPEHASRGEASDLIVLTQGARALKRALRAA